MPDTSSQELDRAIYAVPTEQFHGADGRAVRPCTPAVVTHRHLRMLDVRPGARVMDIGIGSGLSAALLAQLGGPDGRVTAVETEPSLAKRAEALYAEHGHQVTVVVGDGLFGYPQGAPYDRILVGTTPPAIPHAWLQQLKPGGILLCGVRIADLPGAYAIARITVDDKHQPHQVEIHHGGYTPMIAASPPGSVTRVVDPQRPEFLLAILGDHEPSTVASLFAALRETAHVEPTPVPDSDYFHMKNWLIAAEPAGLLEATIGQGTGIGIGSPTPDGTAHAAIVTDEHIITDHAESPALEILRALIHEWLEEGALRTHELPARLTRDGDVWHARVTRA
ncbi:protein-L-isoaspartate(D-aspartate) O-methyltransferase [Streptomyces sp. SLBN-118]|uniref:protein-L-isoaspartate O-methyltransferase family protein n=1 Tax=Streptomyces sp. SLBN-118 TaxID=2768454 RepID=UPI00115356C6|nr:methyltransferase domain-containing protein [Streptomyces sp. SLBN-118]TQK45286.1 protein-L-isoaspartate(D-aspartate) O-methyltransferase [Streptomyces sp. SLBN-118]